VSQLASDPVFIALTRPQMIAGVTYGYAVFNLIVTVEVFLITKSFWTLPVALIIHAIGYLGCLGEWNRQGSGREGSQDWRSSSLCAARR